MYLAYLIAILFILAFVALQKFVDSKNQLSVQPLMEVNKNKSKSRNQRKKSKEKFVPAKQLKNNKNIGDLSIRIFVIVGAVALLSRIILAYFLKGYPSDMSCWIAWGNNVMTNGPGHFYAPEYFCDYPPGYITILGIFAWFNQIFHLSGNATQLMFKLPAILADTVLMISVFVIGSKHMGKKSALILGIILMLNPLLFINSSAWGQVESVLAVFLILSMYNLYKKNYYLSGILYVLAVLMKPQALMVGPVFLFAFVAAKDWKMILKMVVIGVIMLLMFSIPYNYEAWGLEVFNIVQKLLL